MKHCEMNIDRISHMLAKILGSTTITKLRGVPMKNLKAYLTSAAAAAMIISLSACSGMSTQDRNTAIGAGLGGVAGSVLTDGSTLGTVGGAAVGGVVGHGVK